MKDIVIVANFIGALDGGKNSRFTYLAELLSKESDITVEIVSSTFSHDYKRKRSSTIHLQNIKITLIDEPGYKKNISLKRFFSHYIWGKNVAAYLKKRKQPDVIYCAVPSLTGPDMIGKYCKKKGIPFIIDVQDIWPEAFKMVFNIPIISDFAFAPFKRMANNVYVNANDIIAVSNSYLKRALEVNRNASGHVVFLGTDLRTFDRNADIDLVNNAEPYKKNKEVIVYSALPKCIEKGYDEIWVAYCGTLGNSYDLNTAIDAVSLVEEEGFRLKFIVMGGGPKEEEFINHAKEKKIDAIFTGNIPYDKMCSILSHCDITINPIKSKAAASIINKHADYAACGLPVINTQESKEYRSLVDDYNMGFNCNNDDPNDIKDKIQLLAIDKGLRIIQGNNARKCATEKFDRSNTYFEIIETINNYL